MQDGERNVPLHFEVRGSKFNVITKKVTVIVTEPWWDPFWLCRCSSLHVFSFTFPAVPSFKTYLPWPWSLTYLWKTLTLAITFEPEEVERSYFTCLFHVIRPCTLYFNFWPCDLDLAGWLSFQKMLSWAMTFESEELFIVTNYIWLPLAS